MARLFATSVGQAATAPPRRRRRARWLAVSTVVAVIAVVAMLLPVTTQQGVDYVVSTREVPLYRKALEFVDRDANYARLATAVTRGATSDEARALAVFDWTRQHVRSVPTGFPIVDDHVWHVIVRGYGTDDQKADVFTTLATYAGVPAYWLYLGRSDEGFPLSMARVGGRWRVFDVEHGIVFRDAAGELLTVDELAARPRQVEAVAGELTIHGRPYASYVRGFVVPAPSDVLRSELQMPGPRVWFEIRRSVGLGGRPWDPRPATGKPDGKQR